MTYDHCPCGRTYPRLPLGVYGRLDDMLIIRGANVYPSQVQRSLLSVPGTGVEFAIIADREGTMDSVHVQVGYDPTIEPHDVPAFKADLAPLSARGSRTTRTSNSRSRSWIRKRWRAPSRRRRE